MINKACRTPRMMIEEINRYCDEPVIDFYYVRTAIVITRIRDEKYTSSQEHQKLARIDLKDLYDRFLSAIESFCHVYWNKED